MSNDEVKLFDDIEMCFKRISDFLSSKGYAEVRKYIERYETHLNNVKKEICEVEVEIAPATISINKIKHMKQILEHKYTFYKSLSVCSADFDLNQLIKIESQIELCEKLLKGEELN
jgi:DNA polymerase I-like protein with 3'-5' exonuclease and polymerase domains